MNEIKLKVKNIIETNSRVAFIIDDELSFVFKKNESFGIVYDKIPLITIQLNDTIFISMFIDVDRFKMKITNKMFDINTLEELIMTDEDDKSINEKLESIYKIVNRLYNK